MILKKEKRNYKWYAFLCSLVFIFSIAHVKPKSLKEIILNLHDHYICNDIGISSASPGVSERFRHAPLEIAKRTPQILGRLLTGYPERPPIDQIELHIGTLELQSILEDREKALNKGFLAGAREVGGLIEYKGKTMSANIRLKGVLADHWRSKDRMSLRIEIRSEGSILGSKRFALHKPESRQFPYDHTFQEIMLQAGNLASVHKYIKVKVNGENWGVMNFEEIVGKQYLEKLGRRDSFVFNFPSLKFKPGSTERSNSPALNIDILRRGKYLKENEYNRKLLTYIVNKKQSDDYLNLFNSESYLKAYILAKMWGNDHTLDPANSKHYLNPYTLRLEVITTDQAHPSSIENPANSINLQSSIYEEFIRGYDFMHTEPFYFLNTADAMSQGEHLMGGIQKYFPNDRQKNIKVVSRNLDKLRSNAKRYEFWVGALGNDPLKHATEIASTSQQKHLSVFHFKDGTLKIYNLLNKPVSLDSIKVDGETLDVPKQKIPPYRRGSFTPDLIVKTNFRGNQDDRITVRTVCEGTQVDHPVFPTLYNEIMGNPLCSSVKSIPAFIKKSETGWRITKGIWNVNKPVVLDNKLTIDAGAKIQFSESSYLIVKGSIKAEGTEGSVIELRPIKSSWKGIYIYNATDKSYMKNTTISGTTGITDGVLNLTGGMTFYRSNIFMDKCSFINSEAEDALNIVESKFEINDVIVSEVASDGIDFDFSDGLVTNSQFYKISGDALDFSGSVSKITNCKIVGVRDKAISIGEKSTVEVARCQITNVSVGVAAKDGSQANCLDLSIHNYRAHAAMTYNKKDFYETASMRISRSYIDRGSEPFICENGSHMYVGNKRIQPKKMNVKDMYERGIMKK